MGHLPAPQVSVTSCTRAAILFRDGLADPSAPASLLCETVAATWVIHDNASLTQALDAADVARNAGHCVVFALDYEAGALIEPAVKMAHQDRLTPPGVPLGYVWIFSRARWLSLADADAWLMQGAATGAAGCLRGKTALDETAYTSKLSAIRQAIADGEIYQVNFTFPMDVSLYGDPAQVFLNLASAQPTSHAVYVDMPEYQVLSLSPELFFAVDRDRITVRPMKGTAPRCASANADRAQAEALRTSEKNQAENLMIVDLLRNDLGRVAVPGSVSVEALFDIEAYATVHQMTSTVSAQLRTQRLDDLIRGLFPCGSVTGAPKVAAMQKIRSWEGAPRGLYTGTMGWALREQIHANVAIRTLVLDPPAAHSTAVLTGILGLGSGIVWDSNPAEEYAECLLKSDFLVKPDPGFTLFETLRLELPPEDLAGTLPLDEVFPNVRWHITRLERSAFALGFAFDVAAFESCLWQAKAAIRKRVGVSATSRAFRVRVDLSHNGQLQTAWAALPPLAERVGLIWAETRISRDDPLLRHKTSARNVYDAAIEQAMAQQAFDAIFCNEQGEVCEGARSNLFVREGQRLLTPPVRCGLLPGVLRAALLDRGEASEAILSIADIKAASREGRLRVGNALRGLMPATLK